MTEDILVQAQRLRKEGRPDQALLLLEKHLHEFPHDQAARLVYFTTLRDLRRDMESAGKVAQALGISEYRGMSHLDAGVLQAAASGAEAQAASRLAGRLGHLSEVQQAEEALLRGERQDAERLLSRCPAKALPVPWHYVRARLTLASDSGSAAGRKALVDATIAVALMPDCAVLLRAAVDAFRRVGNHKTAARLFDESLGRSEGSYIDNLQRTRWPLSLVRRATQFALVGRPSEKRFLIYTALLHPLLLAPTMLGKKVLALRDRFRGLF